jgi:hypothetical protein
MSNRKINVKIKSSDSLRAVLEELKGSVIGELEVTMTIKDTKDVVSYICRSPHIIDWDDFDSGEESSVVVKSDSESQESIPQEEAIQENEPEDKDIPVIPLPTETTSQEEIVENEERDQYITEMIGVGERNWNEVAWMIEAIWNVAQTSPSLLFGTRFFVSAVKGIYNGKAVTPEHAILTMVLEGYYKNYTWDEVQGDITKKLHESWKSLKGITLSDLATKLYK